MPGLWHPVRLADGIERAVLSTAVVHPVEPAADTLPRMRVTTVRILNHLAGARLVGCFAVPSPQ